MNIHQIIFLILLIVLGIPVILSYILGIKKIKNPNLLWGNTPNNYKKIFGISMITSAISFGIFSFYIFNGNNLNWILIYITYSILLISSTAWIPLTIKVVQIKKKIYWILTRTSLYIVAICSLILLSATILLNQVCTFHIISIICLIIFSIHTIVLDATIWPYFFTKTNSIDNVKM